MNEINGFANLSVHNLVYKDDFCEFTQHIREELLSFPDWVEMRQDGYNIKGLLNAHRQNGITTGHLTSKYRDRLPYCLKFREFLQSRLRELCEIEGIEYTDNLRVEINAMAYGEGAWLSGHTDSGATEDTDDRLIAWMLYLTHPDEGEWAVDNGGAVRLWTREGDEARLSPQFNRFAMFRVHKQSFHEIEKITRQTVWTTCRLALSGWIRGAAQKQAKNMSVYLKSSDYARLRTEVETRLQGAQALYGLMLQQRQHCGVDLGKTVETLNDCRRDYDAHLDAPDGTSFVHCVAGPQGCITVLDEARRVSYFGPRAKYQHVSGEHAPAQNGAGSELAAGVQ